MDAEYIRLQKQVFEQRHRLAGESNATHNAMVRTDYTVPRILTVSSGGSSSNSGIGESARPRIEQVERTTAHQWRSAHKS